MRGKEAPGAALLLAVILNVLFFPYLWGNMNLLSGAHDVPSITDLGGPNADPARPFSALKLKLLDANGSGAIAEPTFALVHRELFVDHELPLWNPDAGLGTPLAAAMQQQPFYPLTALVVAHPSPTTFAWYIVLRLFIAGFATYLFMRYFVGFWPAIVAGITLMLSGYFIHYSTMPELSVETLVGALFLGVEWVLRRNRRWLAVPFLAGVTACDLLGGMPESSFVTIVFAAAYGLFRILTVGAYRARWRASAGALVSALAGGFACSAFLLVPFGEFVFHSFNVHEAAKNGGTISGAIADTFPRTSLVLYLLPLVFGPPWQAAAAGIFSNDGYFGIAIALFAAAAIGYALFDPRREFARPIAFFGVCAALLIAKRYGLPAINWIGYLPVLRMITLVKYDESALAFAFATLAGFGVAALLANRSGARAFAIAACAAALLSLQAAYRAGAPVVLGAGAHANLYFYFALLGGLLTLIASAAFALLATSLRPLLSRNALGALAASIVTAELAMSYFVPMYYVVDPGPSKRQNPYLGAAYVDYLRAGTPDRARIYAENTGRLSPNWAEAFDLQDVRDIDAVYVDRYIPFVKAFLSRYDGADLVTAFSGNGANTMAAPLGQRFLSLTSVRYVVADAMLDPASLLGQIHATLGNDAALARDARVEPCAVAARRVQCLVLHGRPLRITYRVPPSLRRIAFSVGASSSANTAARGVAFGLSVRDRRGVVRSVLQPRAGSGGARSENWPERQVDFSAYAGTTVDITVTARASAPEGTWIGIRDIAESSPRQEPFSPLRVDGATVFQFAHPLPRGALYDNVVVSPSDAATLATLTDPKFDPFQSAVVSAESIPGPLAREIAGLSLQKPSRVRAARLQTYTPERVTFSVDAPRPALLYLSDSYYPGWNASVDSKPASIVRTNDLFRGVFVGPGKHVVEFRYDPISFKAGLAIAAVAVLGLAAFAAVSQRREAAERRAESRLTLA